MLRSFATVPVLVPQCGPNPEGNAMPSLLPVRVGVIDVVVVVTLVVDFDVEAVVVVLAGVPEPGTH